MVSANNYAAGYAEALVLCTPKINWLNLTNKKPKGLSPRRNWQNGTGDGDAGTGPQSRRGVLRGEHAEPDVRSRLHQKLLDNAKVVRFLNSNHPDIFRNSRRLRPLRL